MMRRFVRPCRHKIFNKTVAGSTTVRPEGEAGRGLNSSNYSNLFLKKLNNKGGWRSPAATPSLVKLVFKLIFSIVLVLKLLGFSSIFEVITNTYYLKMYTLTLCSLATLYQLSSIYLLYIFIKKNPKIPEFLPEFLINWQKEFEELSKAESGYFKDFKKSCYTEIAIYLVVIILAFLAL